MVEWSQERHARLGAALSRSTPNNCDEVAREVLPITLEVDPDAHVLELRAKPGPHGRVLKLPLNHAGRVRAGLSEDDFWYHHVTVSTRQHYLDCLTGPDGHQRDDYLSTYFDYPDHLYFQPVVLDGAPDG